MPERMESTFESANLMRLIACMAIAKLLDLKYPLHVRKRGMEEVFYTKDKRPISLWVRSTKHSKTITFPLNKPFPSKKIPFVYVQVINPLCPRILGWAFSTRIIDMLNNPAKQAPQSVYADELCEIELLKPAIDAVIERTAPKSKPADFSFKSLRSILANVV